MVGFGEKLRKLRKSKGMTQKELASLLGVSVSVVSGYEIGDRMPSPEVIVSIAATMHCTTDYLLGIEKSPVEIDVSGLPDDDIAIVQTLVDAMRRKYDNRS